MTSRVRLYRSSEGWHLEYDDTGRFDIVGGGRYILWSASGNISLDAARLDILGRVLASALHASGAICFHASAVAFGQQVIAFLGDKGFGKSTLAWALTRAGARLVTDDTLRVESGLAPTAYPGLHELRLREDTANRLPPVPNESRVAGGGRIVQRLTPTQIQEAPAPLVALYLLQPVRTIADGSAARATLLPSVQATIALVRHAKIAPLLSGRDAGTMLDRVVALARAVPVQLLEVTRDFERLEDVVSTVCDWHRAPGTGTIA